jgi:hypothetical protein
VFLIFFIAIIALDSKAPEYTSSLLFSSSLATHSGYLKIWKKLRPDLLQGFQNSVGLGIL